jgi:hypothetical protein
MKRVDRLAIEQEHLDENAGAIATLMGFGVEQAEIEKIVQSGKISGIEKLDENTLELHFAANGRFKNQNPDLKKTIVMRTVVNDLDTKTFEKIGETVAYQIEKVFDHELPDEPRRKFPPRRRDTTPNVVDQMR